MFLFKTHKGDLRLKPSKPQNKLKHVPSEDVGLILNITSSICLEVWVLVGGVGEDFLRRWNGASR